MSPTIGGSLVFLFFLIPVCMIAGAVIGIVFFLRALKKAEDKLKE